MPELPSPHLPEMVVPVRALSNQIELFNHLLSIVLVSNLKSYSCVKILYIIQEYLINRGESPRDVMVKELNCRIVVIEIELPSAITSTVGQIP